MNCIRINERLLFMHLLFIVVSLLFVPIPTFSAEKDIGLAVTEKFRTTENSIDKRRIVQSIAENEVTTNTAVSQWKVSLIREALLDKSPVVAEAAVKQAGNLELKELTPQLVDLFETAENRFYGGYAERVRVSLFQALGKTGGETVTGLFKGFLENDNGSFLGESALLAIKELDNPVLVNTVKEYILKMEKRVAEKKAIKADPINYSRYLMYIQLGKEVKESLLNGRGGSK